MEEAIICYNCHKKNPADSIYCCKCGVLLTIHCFFCQQKHSAEEQFCPMVSRKLIDEKKLEDIKANYCKDKKKTEFLQSLAKGLHDMDSWVRYETVSLFGGIDGAEVIPYLARTFKDEDEMVRRRAVEALGSMNSCKARAVFFDFIFDSSKLVKEAVIKALPVLRRIEDDDDSAFETIDDDEFVEFFIKLNEEEGFRIREKIIKKLANIGNKRAFDTLISSGSLKSKNHIIRSLTVEALGKIGSKKAVPILLEALDYNPPEVLENIVDALARICDTSVLPDFEGILRNSPLLSLKMKVVPALAFMGAKKNLIEIIENENEHISVRVKAIEALQLLDEPEILDYLLSLVEKENEEIRLKALECVADSPGKNSYNAFLTALKDPSETVREKVIELISQRERSSYMLPILLEALKNENSIVRGKAAECIGDYSNKQAIPYLLKAFNDPDKFVKEKIVESIGKLKDAETIDLLAKTLFSDPHYSVRRKAALALGEIGGQKAVKILVKAKNIVTNSLRWAYVEEAIELEDDILSALDKAGYFSKNIKMFMKSAKSKGDLPLFVLISLAIALVVLVFVVTGKYVYKEQTKYPTIKKSRVNNHNYQITRGKKQVITKICQKIKIPFKYMS